MKHFEYNVIIRESLLDIYGHVNNAAFITLFEEARWEFVSVRGYGVNEILQTGLGPIILGFECKFKKELKARDKVRITVEPLEYKLKIGKIRQRMIKENGDIACEAVFNFGIFDSKKRKLVVPDDRWRQALALDEIDYEVKE